MSDTEVRIVKLPPLRVACINGFGESPENMAFERLKDWAKTHKLLGKPYRLFGYNNPDPSPGSPNYGYDVWITVNEAVQADGEVKIIDFPGGLYAVIHLEVKDPYADIPGTWQQLVKWMENSKYRHARHQWLEEHIGSLHQMGGEQPFTLDLYLPITE